MFYISDLSREGLASVISMHPNYFSPLFNSITSISMTEYINTLRIEDAVKQLKSGGTKIIDIAFAAGFGSLSTFNRVFKKITGKTPLNRAI